LNDRLAAWQSRIKVTSALYPDAKIFKSQSQKFITYFKIFCEIEHILLQTDGHFNVRFYFPLWVNWKFNASVKSAHLQWVLLLGEQKMLPD